MKLFLAVAAAFLPLCLGQVANLPDCVAEGSYDPDRDYFPDKVDATESLFWDIQYFNNYKIIRNELAGETYVLYQCGTPPPTDQDNAGHEHFIPVPLKDGITLSSTTHIPHLELLGLRTEIKAWVETFSGSAGFISSPCLNQMINEADVTVVDSTNQAAVDGLKGTFGSNLVSFHDNRDAYESTVMNVTVSVFSEKSNEAIYEWNKFFAAFFNMEKKANELFSTTSERYQCVAEEAIDIVDVIHSGIKPTVVWATYTNFSGIDGWTLANCPNYYCEYAEKCASELVNSLDGTIDFFGSMIFTTEDFVALAKDAEHFIYPSGNWDEAYAAYGPILDTFRSVKEKKVFDNQGSAPNSWFGNRLAEYRTFGFALSNVASA
jgi:iron complex transport system substrate-binding protein